MTATAIFACLAVFLCACGSGADDPSTTEPSFSTAWSEAQVFSLPSETPASEPSGTQTDTDAILRRIETARAVFGLFSETRPPLDKTDSVEVQEGLLAYRVSDPQFDSLEKLNAYVSDYFSPEITQRLLSVGIYVEVDGKLYALDVGTQTAQTGDLRVEVTEKSDTSESYRLTVGSDTQHAYSFVYAKQADGKWVFTKFEAY